MYNTLLDQAYKLVNPYNTEQAYTFHELADSLLKGVAKICKHEKYLEAYQEVSSEIISKTYLGRASSENAMHKVNHISVACPLLESVASNIAELDILTQLNIFTERFMKKLRVNLYEASRHIKPVMIG